MRLAQPGSADGKELPRRALHDQPVRCGPGFRLHIRTLHAPAPLKASRMDDPQSSTAVIAIDETTHVLHAKADRQAFAPLYVAYFDRVHGYCLRRLGNPEEAADATSIIFSRAMESIGSCRETSFRSWLFAIAHNTLVDFQRTRRYDQSIDERFDLHDRAPGPEDEALRQESMRVVTLLLSQLPTDQRNVLELRLAGLTSREIGSVLGKLPNAVDQAQFRAMQRLKDLTIRAGDALEGLR